MSAVLVYILITLAFLLGLVLLVPIHFDLLGEYKESLSLQGRVRWAWRVVSLEIIRSEGRFHWTLSLLGLKKVDPKREGEAVKSEKTLKSEKSLEKKRGDSINNLSSFINLQLFTAMKDVLHKFVRALHMRLNLSGMYGFDDPSLTGITVGLIAAFNRGKNSIDLNPDFTREVVDVRGSFKGWFVPLQILAIGLVFLFKKPVRAIWWPKIKLKRKQKEAVKYA